MQRQYRTDQEIADDVNSVPYEKSAKRRAEDEKAEDQLQKSRLPLYVIVAVAFLIGAINGIYIGSDIVFLMCLIFGGGTFVYLYLTRNNGPDLPVTNSESHRFPKNDHD